MAMNKKWDRFFKYQLYYFSLDKVFTAKQAKFQEYEKVN